MAIKFINKHNRYQAEYQGYSLGLFVDYNGAKEQLDNYKKLINKIMKEIETMELVNETTLIFKLPFHEKLINIQTCCNIKELHDYYYSKLYINIEQLYIFPKHNITDILTKLFNNLNVDNTELYKHTKFVEFILKKIKKLVDKKLS